MANDGMQVKGPVSGMTMQVNGDRGNRDVGQPQSG